MPRRRSVNQPSLKSPEKEDGFDIVSEDESPQKLRIQETASSAAEMDGDNEQNSLVKITQLTRPEFSGMRTRGKGRLTRSPKHISEVDESTDHVHHLPRAVAVPVETVYTTLQPPVIIDKSNESSQSGDGKQQSLSLEALCQAAKSELQIISKEKCQEAEVEIIQPVETETKIDDIQLPDHSIIQVASGSDTQNIVFGGQGSGETELYNLEKVTSADGEDTWVLKPSTKKILYQGNETQGISSSIESIDQQSPQIITVPYTTTTSPGVVHYVGQQDMDRQIGRRRKHPAKPGKHICPYCSRGCTKPSVLEKHIRAHTGERPFPCEPCGFSFKTKSNLYKHCKSRAHQMKVASSTSTSSQTSSMDIDEGEEDGGSFDSDTQGLGGSSKAKNVKTTVKSPGTKLILPAMTPPQGNSPVIIGQQVNQGAAPFMLLLKQGQDGTTVIKPAYTIGSPGVTQMSKEATVVTSAIKQQPKFTVTSVASSIARISSPPSSAVIVSPPSSSRVFKTEPKFPTQISSASSFKLGGAGQPVSKLEDLYVKSTVEKLPGNSMKVTIQLPKPESTDTGVKAAAHGLITPIGLPRTPLGKPRIPTVPKLPAPKNLTPDELKERISYLIDTNQAIVNTPMAEPPRPKRFARQRSEILFGTTQDADGIFSDGTHLTVGPLTPKDKFGRAASFDVGQLKKIEMNQSNIDSITGTRDSDLVNVIPLSKVDESVRNIGKDVTVTSSTATHHHHNLPDSFPPPTQGFVVYQDSGDIVLQSSIHDDDDNDEGDNVEVMVNDPEEDNENPLIIINSNADKTANDTSGIIDISDDETVSFQDSLKPIPEPKDLISIGHSSSIEEGIAKQMKSLSQLSHDKQTEETIQISLESSDLNEDGIFSEEGKSFACMECHIIFSNLSDVMTHLVENCPSLHSGTGNQKIDVFKTDGSHSILTVVKKRVMEEPAVVSDSMSLVSVVSNGSGSYTSNKNIAQLSTSESVTVGESSNFDEKIRLKIIEQSPNEISQTISHGSYGNVVLEMVDPTAPLKRGRPKGSRNRPKESSSSTEGGSFSSEVGDIAYVGAWKTPPIGASPFHFPNKNGSNDLSPMPQEVDVIQLPVTEGMFKGYRSATASMRGTPNKPPLRLTIPQLGTTGVNSPPPPFSAGIRPKVSTPVPIKSSPLILSPVKIQPASPVKLLSTPQKADAKKALQSHILMKRSLSVEKVAQDKQRQFSLPGGFNSIDLTTSDIKSTIQSSFTPQTTSKSLKVKDMLRPTRSLEEAPQTKRPRLQRQASVFEAPPEGADNIITVTTKGKEGPSVALTVNNSITMKLPTIDSDSLMLHESYTKEINPSSKDILSPPKCIITITPPPISIEQDVKDILANIIKLANPNEQAESYYDVNLPYNIGKTVLRGSNPTTAPCFKIPTHDNQTLQLVNLPKSIAYKIPGLVESETNVRSSSVDSGSNTEIKETTEDVNKAHFQNSEKSNESEDKCEDGVGMSTEEETTADKKRRLEQDESKSEETMESDEKKQKTEHSDSSVSMDVQLCSSSLTGDLTDLILPLSDGSLLSLEKDNNARLKKEMVLDLENAGKGPQLSIPAHLQDKAKIVMMLLGHSYPVIKPNTHGTLCSITKPQPMYVKQNDNQKISMYSTWRAAPFNPNPEGLTTKQLLKLYTSTRIDNHPYFVSAASDELSKPQVTDSLNWEDKENTSVEPENDVSTESNSPLKSQNRLDIPRRTKSGLVCTVKEFKSKENSSKQVGQKMKQEQFQKREKTPTKSSPSSAEPPVITIQSIPHQVEQESSKETDVLDDRRVYILPKPQVSSEMLSFDGNYEMQNLSLQGSDYILLKPRVTVQQTAQQKRHQLQAHGLKGFKSEENYTYVRGRGRGKYVCQECGIRCKKPSMLRKHLKTHTDMRPYHCKYCMFSFKTKGNLTKHMKSKAHQKKCTELGIFPIPVYVDESCVLTNEQMNAQHSAFTPGDEDQSSEQTVIVDGTIPVLQSATSQFSTMGSSMEDDDDLDDDEDDSLDRGEEVEEEQVSFDNMLVLDTEESVQQQQQQVTLFDSEKNKPEEKYLTVRETESGEPMLLKLSKDKDGNTRTEIVPLTPEHKQRLREGSPRDSVDKEVANSLLDLAQRPQDGETGESKDTSLDSKQDLSASGSSQKSGDRLEGLIGQLVDRTGDQVKVTTEQGTKSHDSSFTVIEHPLLYASSEMKTKDPTNNNQLKLTREGQTSSKSGFVPPSFEDQQALKTEDIPPLVVKFPSSKIEVAQTKQLLHQIIKDYLKPGQKVVLQGVESSNLPPVISDIIPLESRTREPLLEDYSVKVEYTGTGLSSEPVKSSSVMSIPAASSHHQMYSSLSPRIHSPNSQVNNSTVHKSDLTKGRSERDDENNQNSKVTIMQRHTLNDRHFKLQRQKSQDDEMDTSNLQDYLELIQNKQYNDTGKKVVELGVKIKPIPGRVNQSELEKVDGKYVCKICRKCFQEGHLLQKHLQVHAFEQPFKCADCMTSFRTSEQLDRHMSSEAHLAQLNLKRRLGLMSNDDPRPYKCQDCNVAFRIHGHLAKHLRSKLHIMQLENMGKIPMGTAMELEKIGPQMNVLDAESCLEDILSMIKTGVINVDQTSDIIRPQFTSIKDFHSQTFSPVTVMSNALTASKSASFGGYSTGGNTVIFSTVVATPTKNAMSSSSRGNSPLVVNLSAQDREALSASLISPQKTSERVKVEMIKSESLFSQDSQMQHGKASPSLTSAPHKCGICGSRFVQMDLLKEHLVSHAELRPYVCEFCDAGFTAAKSLQAHLLSHASPTKNYACCHCNKIFSEVNDLVKHSQQCTVQQSTNSAMINVKTQVLAQTTGNGNILSPHRSPKLGQISRVRGGSSFSAIAGTSSMSGNSSAPRIEIVKTLHKSASEGGAPPSSNVQVIPVDGNTVQMKEVMQEQPDGSRKAVKVMVINWDSIRGNSQQHHDTVIPSSVQTVSSYNNAILSTATSSDSDHRVSMLSSVVVPSSGSLFDPAIDLDIEN